MNVFLLSVKSILQYVCVVRSEAATDKRLCVHICLFVRTYVRLVRMEVCVCTCLKSSEGERHKEKNEINSHINSITTLNNCSFSNAINDIYSNIVKAKSRTSGQGDLGSDSRIGSGLGSGGWRISQSYNLSSSSVAMSMCAFAF